MHDPAGGDWHVDKRIPAALIISLLFAFVGQTTTIAWWASKVEFRVGNMEVRLNEAADQRDRIIRLETQSQFQTEILLRLERKLDRTSMIDIPVPRPPMSR